MNDVIIKTILFEIYFTEGKQPSDKYIPDRTIYVSSNIMDWAINCAFNEARNSGMKEPVLKSINFLGACNFLTSEIKDILENGDI